MIILSREIGEEEEEEEDEDVFAAIYTCQACKGGLTNRSMTPKFARINTRNFLDITSALLCKKAVSTSERTSSYTLVLYV